MPSGNVLGFDLTALMQAAEALGYSKRTFASLIGSAEAGMLLGIKDIQHGDA
ncbi:MAG: hypothetical protein KGI29_09105 [Pseudomonadota bacterium]|nr:hypothetical protein [Pseudomonadota bacterium]MDE3038509.1 hypothetical protein [Pseudomonadota bacterium]